MVRKNCSFPHEFPVFCHLSLLASKYWGYNWSFRKWRPANRKGLYTRIALRALKVSYSDVGEGGIAVNCEKKQVFLNTLYMNNQGSKVFGCGYLSPVADRIFHKFYWNCFKKSMYLCIPDWCYTCWDI